MFGFLKDKLKQALSKFKRDVDEKSEEVKEEKAEKPKEKTVKEQKKEKEAVKKGQKEEISKEAKKIKKIGQKKEEAEEKEAVEAAEKALEEKTEEEQPEEISEEEQKEESEEEEEPEAEKEPAEETEEIKEPKEEQEELEEKGFFARLKDKFVKKEEKEKKEEKQKEEKAAKEGKEAKEEKAEQIARQEESPEKKKEQAYETKEEPEEEKGFFRKLAETITKKTLSEEKFEEIFWDLEVALLENNVAVEVIDKIKDDLKRGLVNKKLDRGRIEETIENTLKDSIKSLFDTEKIDLIRLIKSKKQKPFTVIFVGVNGSGKTTTIAKMAKYFQNNRLKCVIAASDTFRAAAIQQLEEHADRLGVRLIKQDYGADPAAVAFDAVKYAESKNIDVVMVDTAGRLHSNTNLMDEMKKIVRVAKPDLKIFIGESITGNDCVEQAKHFNEAVGIDGIILAKADIDEKGGAAISVSYVTGKPIMFIGVGQRYDDLKEFDEKIVMESMGF